MLINNERQLQIQVHDAKPHMHPQMPHNKSQYKYAPNKHLACACLTKQSLYLKNNG